MAEATEPLRFLTETASACCRVRWRKAAFAGELKDRWECDRCGCGYVPRPHGDVIIEWVSDEWAAVV